MILELAENKKISKMDLSNYVFVPYSEGTNKGGYIRKDVYDLVSRRIQNYKGQSLGLSSFFGDIWGGVKDVIGTVAGAVTGHPQGQPPVIIQQAPPPPATVQQVDNTKTLLLIGAAALGAIFLMKKK